MSPPIADLIRGLLDRTYNAVAARGLSGSVPTIPGGPCVNDRIYRSAARFVMSIWWLLAAFVAGGYAGMLLFALMHAAARHEHHKSIRRQLIGGGGVGPLNAHTHAGLG